LWIVSGIKESRPFLLKNDLNNTYNLQLKRTAVLQFEAEKKKRIKAKGAVKNIHSINAPKRP